MGLFSQELTLALMNFCLKLILTFSKSNLCCKYLCFIVNFFVLETYPPPDDSLLSVLRVSLLYVFVITIKYCLLSEVPCSWSLHVSLQFLPNISLF
jgi:hypothetical protein